MNKIRLAEKRYRDKLKKDKKEIRLNTKKHKKQNKKLVKVKMIIKETFIKYENQKKQQKLQKNQ